MNNTLALLLFNGVLHHEQVVLDQFKQLLLPVKPKNNNKQVIPTLKHTIILQCLQIHHLHALLDYTSEFNFHETDKQIECCG